jgi:hypothetical protein
VSGAQSTVTWGEGNLELDPRFVDAGGGDYHLAPGSPALEAGTAEGAPALDLEGNPRLCGSGVDLGPYERCESPPTRFRRGDVNADGGLDIADAIAALLHLFRGAPSSCRKSHDVNDDGAIDIADPIHLLRALFQAAPSPAAPYPGCGLDPNADALTCESFACGV